MGYGLQLWSMAALVSVPEHRRPARTTRGPITCPITYELVILFAAFTALIGMILLNGFPRPYHPVFNVPQFARATTDRFFLLIEATDPKFYDEKPVETLDEPAQTHATIPRIIGAGEGV